MFVSGGHCSYLPKGFTDHEKVVPSDIFYPCLEEALTKVDEERRKDLRWINDQNDQQRRLSGFKSKIHAKRIENASTAGVDFLNELR